MTRSTGAVARFAGLTVTLALTVSACTSTATPDVGATSAPATSASTVTSPATSPSSSATASPKTSQKIVFGDPWSKDPARVHAVSRSAIRIIDSARRGQTLTFAMFNLTYPGLAESLIRASRRGVAVRVVVNGEGDGGRQTRALRAELGTSRTARSFFRVRAGGMRMHSKFLLLSSRDASGPVVWTASGNVTMAGGRDQANESMTTTGDQALYDFLAAQFALMSKDVTDPRRLARTADTATAFVESFPLPKGGAKNDPVLRLLDDISCVHGDGHTVLRLAHYLFSHERLYLADKLRDLVKAGCDVRMAGFLDGWDRVNVQALIKPGPGRVDLRDVVGTDLHTKITSIEGWDAAGNPLQVVMVGTHNLTGRALSRIPEGVNDEIALTIRDPKVVDTYSAWVDWVISKHSRPAK